LGKGWKPGREGKTKGGKRNGVVKKGLWGWRKAAPIFLKVVASLPTYSESAVATFTFHWIKLNHVAVVRV